MKKIILLVFLFFCLVVFLKPTFYDFDSYYYLSLACGKIHNSHLFFHDELWKFLPCNELFFKFLQITVLGIVLFLLVKIGEKIEPKYKYWFPLIVSFYLYFFSNFFRLENDLLGWPFIFLSLFFLVQANHEKEKTYRYWASLLVSLIGIIFWQGCAVWVIIVLLSHPKIKWAGIGLIIFYYNELFIGNAKVLEDQPIYGVAFNILIWIGFLFVPSYLFLATVFGFLLALFRLKFAVFFAIPLLIGLYQILCKKKFFENDLPINFKLPGINPPISKQQLFLIIILIFSFVEIAGQFNATPNIELVNFSKKVVLVAGDQNITNEWPLGHLLTYFGGHPLYSSGPPGGGIDFNSATGFVLTLQKLDCNVLDSIGFQDSNLIFYHC